MSADSAVSIAWDVFKIVFVPIKRQFEYVMCSKRYSQDLQKEVEELAYQAERIHNAAEEARNNLQNIHGWVPGFLESAEKALNEAEDLLGKFKEASKSCCRGTLPDPNCRYQFSRRAKHMTDDIKNLIQANRDWEVSFRRPPPGNVVDQSTTAAASASSASTSIKPREDDLFESRTLMIQNVMDALANTSNSVVGVHGMGGVGKSTLLLDVEKRIRQDKSFDRIAKADVSDNPDIKRIQGEIADALSLSHIKDKESISGRAKLLRERLENEERDKKKVLIILDDLWEQLDLDKVGIPCGPDNKARGCKLLLTARDRSVLIREMRCDSAFLLGELEKEEAERLFKTMVGGKVEVELEPLVEEALRICAGLPFLIVQISNLFRDTTYSACKDDLKQIWSEETGEVINKTLRRSYERIKSEKAKSLLQLIAVYGVSKPSLENLVRYGFGLGLFGEESSMEDARIRLNKLTKTLQDASLLLRSEEVVGFKIHDLVREFVASVASKDHPLLVLKGESVTELPTDKLRSCGAVCFPHVDLKKLPEELVCPELRIFLLFSNNKSLEIPDSYFNSMKNLVALDLAGIHLSRSPSPFQFLKKLHSLCLDYCSLEDVAILGELKALQILSLRSSDIQRLPKEIGQLAELRLLDLSHSSRLKIILPGVLGSLTKLEELYMEGSFDQWSATEQTPPTKASLIELNNMQKLRTLYVSIPDPSVLPKDLDVEKLTKYRIRIGNPLRPSQYEGSRTLDLKLGSTSDVLPKECIKSIFDKIDDLFLDRLKETEQSICAFSQKGFPQLKHLRVQNSPSICYILKRPSSLAFKALETLLVENMINLEKIINNNISTESFSSLRVVRVQKCDKMQVLFPRSVVRELRQLEQIVVKRCELMRGIVEDGDDRGKFELPNLRVLELHALPNIENFIIARSSPSSGTSNGQVGAQIAFFNGQQVAFPKLESLKIVGCHNVGFIFSQSMVISLAQLRKLSVSYCEKMEAIIMEEEGPRVETSETMAFPMLTDLYLETLKSLTCFSHEKCSREGRSQDRVQLHPGALFTREVAFPKLESLKIVGCHNVGFMFSQSMVISLAQLRKLSVSYCEKMEAIIMEEEGLRVKTSETMAFPMLIDLYLEKLKSLTCFSHEKCSPEGRSQDHVQLHPGALFSREVSFPSLESLTIGGLPNLKEIWSDESPLEPSNLRSLKVVKVVRCETLSKVISFRSLVQLHKLQTLCITNCSSVQEIFDFEGPSASGIVETLLELTTLELRHLGSLRRIWNKNPSGIMRFHNLKELKLDGCENLEFIFFPSMVKSLAQLRDLTVSNCKKMEMIIAEEEGLGVKKSEILAFPMLTNLKLTYLKSLTSFFRGKCSREARSEDHINSHSALLFSREVVFPILETLSINGMDNIDMIWDNQVAADSFPKLKSLQVDGCNKLVTVVPPFVLGRLKSLESLDAGDCGSLEVVFGPQPLIPLDGHPVALPLKELTVSGLPRLKCVWDKELHHQVKFQHLRSVSVSKCTSLTSLFPASVTRDLIQLEKLVIRECSIVELIENEGGLLVPRFVFPKLTSLQLEQLTELKCLYTGTHTSHWPALETLMMDDCNKVEILASQTESEISHHKQSLFLIEKGAFPNLQELKLDLSKGVEIWHGNFHDEESFCKLRVLKLRHLSKEYAISTCRFGESLTNLEELVVSESFLEEPTNNVEAIDGPCPELKVMLPFSRRVQHLKTLDVSHSHGLSSMFTPTIAENLVALTKLRIRNCRILIEVISDDEFEEERAVAFGQLKHIKLEGLIKLRCFSSSGCTLMFPLLEDVLVNGCPSMEFFSNGPIEAPKMERVKAGSQEQYFWKGNLNITIQNMYEEMASATTAQFLRLFEFPKLIEKWHGDLNPLKSSRQLKTLVVDKCPSFINAMPSKLMLVLEEMERLQVHYCESLEEIFDLQGLEGVESTRVLPRLRDLDLINLPKLRQLWNKDLQGTMCFNSLSYLTVYKCSNLRHAFTPSMARCLPNLGRMEIKECCQMIGVIKEEERHGSTMAKTTFPRLYRMELEWLPNLTSFLSGKDHELDCPKISYLTIAHCPKMRSLTWQPSMDIDQSTPSLFTPQVQFPGLRKMALSHMDNLSKIWSNNPLETLTFDSLKKVEVQNCKRLENLFPHWVAKSLTQLEELRVESCRIEEIVANGDGTPHSDIAQVPFSKLTSLVLHDMPRLKTFCPNLPTLNWPFLTELRVTHCDKVNMLSFAASMNKRTQRDDQQDLSEQEAHSSLERDFPKLKRRLLDDKDIRMIRDGKYPDDVFGKPKALTLACFHEENAVFPSKFLLERFQNLESLEVFCGSFEGIFPDEGIIDEGKHSVLNRLRELKLSKLHKLKRVWREDCLVSKIIQSIKTLEVWECPSLTTVFPAVTSFQNLTMLVVKNSSGLVHLGTASAITSLVHLYSMTIIGCERMTAVLADDENGEGKVISFGGLGWLTLQDMPSLECFSSTTSCILRFPSLVMIEVEECPKMKIFSKGTLSTPTLWHAKLFRYKYRNMEDWNECWKGDLNRAIRELSA